MIAYRTIQIDGTEVFYREGGDRTARTLLLLHGYPSSSTQYQSLMERLEDRYHVIAPDYPGFGQSPPLSGTTTFDRIADVIDGFTHAKDLDGFSLYMFDFGSPVGFRLATRQPERVQGLVLQNGNACEEGLGPSMQALKPYWQDRSANESAVREFLQLDATRSQYLEQRQAVSALARVPARQPAASAASVGAERPILPTCRCPSLPPGAARGGAAPAGHRPLRDRNPLRGDRRSDRRLPRDAPRRGAIHMTPALMVEVITMPVSDVDRALRFYVDQVGFALDVDFAPTDAFRVAQLTPPGSSCSIQLGTGLTDAPAGSVRKTYLVVTDLQTTREGLLERGVQVSEIRYKTPLGAWDGGFGRGPDPDRGDYASFADFADPDGNTWVLQERGFRQRKAD
jgi:pimeloyl-ACP methyl ester carboxylesterase